MFFINIALGRHLLSFRSLFIQRRAHGMKEALDIKRSTVGTCRGWGPINSLGFWIGLRKFFLEINE